MPMAIWAAGDFPHYDVSWSKDMPVTFLSAFTAFFGSYRYSQMEKPEPGDYRDVSELPPWDRPVAGRYNESAEKASKWAAVLGVAPLAMAGYSYKAGDATGQDVAGFSLMFAQALALQSGINLMVRSLEFWPRPYIYAEDGAGARKAKKAEAEAYGSFFSGHTSAAFTVAVFTGEWFSEFYPESSYRGVVWALALSAAGLEGVLRVAAGKHFWSDVAVGALLGTGVSLAVIQVHKKRNNRVSLWAGPGSVGLTVRM